MFIMSKKNFKVRRADGSSFLIRKNYIGEIPADVASNWLIQEAIKSGSIATPQGMKDKALEEAGEAAAEKAAAADIRPDAENGSSESVAKPKAENVSDKAVDEGTAETEAEEKKGRAKK